MESTSMRDGLACRGPLVTARSRALEQYAAYLPVSVLEQNGGKILICVSEHEATT
jgi:hypothetical protein